MKKLRFSLLSILLGVCQMLCAQNTGLSVGTPDGSFSVTPLGGASYSIPIETPPGICGMEPRLSIAYNSLSGNGLCGWGCSVGGISVITRGAKDIYHDGGASGITHGMDDAFFLDGQRLVMTQAPAGSDSAVYCLETNPYTRIVLHGLNASSQYHTYFTVLSPDGMTYNYGTISACQFYYVNSTCKVNAWYLCAAESPEGNTIDYYYNYSSDDHFIYPSEIKYGSAHINHIKFEYEGRPDTLRFSLEGVRGYMGKRLKSIKAKSVFNENEELFRSYTLNYALPDNSTAGYSRLTSVSISNGDSQSMNPITFSWNSLKSFCCNKKTPNFQTSLYTDGAVENEMSFFAADLNGDGLTDLVEKATTHIVNINDNFIRVFESHTDANGEVYFTARSFTNLGTNVSNDLWSDIYHSPVATDMDGDGISEIVIPRYVDYPDWNAFGLITYKNGQTLEGVQYADLHVTGMQNILWSAADFDNDGKCDFVVVEKAKEGSTSYYGCIMGGYGVTAFCQYFRFSLPKEPKHLLTADMNCDGLTDVVVFYQNGYSVFYNDGTWLDNITPGHLLEETPIQPSPSAYSNALNPAYVWQGDFNGDGITDFLVSIYDSGNLYFELGNGNGTLEKSVAASTAIYDQSGTTKDDNEMNCQVVDMDGDGLSDVVITKAMYKKHNPVIGSSYYRFNKTYTYWMRSNGKQLVTQKTATSVRESDALYQHYVSGDFNGDGLCEVASLSYDCYNGNEANEDALFHIYQNANYQTADGMVHTITDGLGRQTHISYKPLTDGTVYTKGSSGLSFPVVTLTPSLPVVSTVQDDNQTGETQYSYEGLKLHVQGRGLLGMTATTAHQITLGQTVKTRVDSLHSSSFLPVQITETLTMGSDSMKTITVNTYTNYRTALTYVPVVKTVWKTDFDGNTTYEQNQFAVGCDGNVMLSYRGLGDNTSEEAFYDYEYHGKHYVPYLAGKWYRRSGQNYNESFTTYTYNNKGQVTLKTENDSTDFALTTAYTYNYRGNLASATTTGSGVAPVTKEWLYDNTNRFVTRYTENGYIRKDYTYDNWGNVLTETDNTRTGQPLTTTYTYDGWGRLATSTSPEGIVTAFSYGWGPSATRRYFNYKTMTGAPWVRTWYDNTGRETFVESIGPKGVQVSTQTTYDSKGQVTAILSTEGQRTRQESSTYDARGRLQTHTATPGTQTSYSYGNRTVTATANGRSHTEQYNARGSIIRAVDPIGSVFFQYAPNGKPVTASSSGVTVSMAYDEFGNQTSLNDPDAGLQQYTYDVLRRVTSQTDGNGILTTNTYNTRGQLAATTANNVSTTYTYGTGTTDNGLLLSMNRSYFTAAYQYDSIGRMTEETRYYGPTISRTKSQTYNAQGLVATRTYPGGLTIGYEYDSYGHLLRMKHGTDIIYEVTAYNGTGMTEALGANLTRFSTFDNAGRLTHSVVQVGSLTADTIASQHYTYNNATGNLMSRTVGDGEPEEFTFDAVDRLTRVDYDGGDYTYVYYDPNGNIETKYGTKSQIGSYYYYGSRPHAVTDLEDPFGPVSLPSGNVTVTYNELGKVSQINDDGYAVYPLRYLYGPDHERWLASGVKAGMPAQAAATGIRYFGDYEERFSGSTVQRRFVYLDGGVLAMATGNGSYAFYYIHTDHQGSVFAITDEDGDDVFRATYDAWGRQTVQQNDIAFFRGYTGHEMVAQGCLINMNGRLYDPSLGLFLSPDNYVQQPTNSQNFNRYSYCLNNPLKYVDPSGEFWHIIVGAIVGGITNLAANWNNIDGFWQGFTAFTVGAGAGAAVAATGGTAGAGVWSVMGVSAASGAVTSATNNIIAQTGRNFSGIENVNWTDVGKSSLVGAVSGAASGAAGYYAQNLTTSVQGIQIKSPILKSAIVSPLASGAGHITGGTAYGLLEGLSFKDAFSNSWDGILNSMAIGGAIGVASTLGECSLYRVNPFTGKSLMTAYEIGQQGVERAIDEFVAQGGTNIQREVTIGVDGVRVRVDFAGYDKNGLLQLFEVKNGPFARPTPNQKIVIPKLLQGAPFVPFGNNANRLNLPLKVPYSRDYRFHYIHYNR